MTVPRNLKAFSKEFTWNHHNHINLSTTIPQKFQQNTSSYNWHSLLSINVYLHYTAFVTSPEFFLQHAYLNCYDKFDFNGNCVLYKGLFQWAQTNTTYRRTKKNKPSLTAVGCDRASSFSRNFHSSTGHFGWIWAPIHWNNEPNKSSHVEEFNGKKVTGELKGFCG